MAEQLKNWYNSEFVEKLGTALKRVDPKFKTLEFKIAIINKDWEEKELKARALHITKQMALFLPYPYKKQLEILKKIAPEFGGFTAVVFPTFIEHFGLGDFETSLESMAYFTQFSTSEFAIRPFLIKNPETIQTLYAWSKSENFHIRRLASEGCRPLLPWAMKLHQYVTDPTPILPILETLRNDPEDYVYRSVANSLNDISKNQPTLVLDLCDKWMHESKTTQWVAKHALRTLLKKGNQRAMQLFGFGSIKSIETINFTIVDNKITIGDHTHLKISVMNNGKTAKFRLEYAVGYLKKNGKHNEKIFQLRENTIEKGEILSFDKKLAFKDLSTRKHYTGTHYVVLKINGNETEKTVFDLI